MSVAVFAAPGEQPGSRRLWKAIGISLALHGLFLTLHFKFPDATRNLQEKALDIILVNAKTANKPLHPQALAQAHADGGGNTDDERRAKTPLPPQRQQETGKDLEHLQRRVREMEIQQQKVLTQARSSRPAPATPGGEAQPRPTPLNGLDLAESARAMARLEGEISKSLDEYSKRPRKKFVGTRAEEYRFAQYIEEWRQKIERIGTLNYPEAARGKLYGSLVLSVSIKSDGSVSDIEINRSSGYRVLDDAARRIVNLGAPYAAFPPDIRRDTDVLVITRSWAFTRTDNLETRPQ